LHVRRTYLTRAQLWLKFRRDRRNSYWLLCSSAQSRNNERVQATSPLTGRARRARQSPGARSAAGPGESPVSTRALHGLGALGLLGVFTSVFLLTAGAASVPTQYVPARSGGWPSWLAGPLEGLGVGIGSASFQTLTLIMAASYVAVLLAARTLSGRALWVTIIAAHLVLLLGPPLISQDVFGYLDFARLGALHGLDPYTHVAAQAPTDTVYLFVGWPFQNSPYGPLFTLGSYALVPLGVAGGLWALKALAVATSLAAIALVTRASGKEALSEKHSARVAAACERESRSPRTVLDGHSPRFTAAFVGLNPVLLELAVGGDHNDTLLLLALAGALLFTAGASPRFRAGAVALVAGIGIKVTAGLALPFLLLAPPAARERLRVVGAAGLSLAALAVVGLIGFGSHAFGFASAVSEQQQLVATHSIPAETARLVGLHGTPSWWRHCFLAGFVLVFAYALWRTLRGADWRVAAGWSTLALLLCTAWLLPWYAIWALPLAAVSGDRRLRAATLVLCAYALLIHLPLANGLLSPQHVTCHTRKDCVPGGGFRIGGHRIHLTGLKVPDDVTLDLRR
jgi:alpha-1,6-mannosyltransferase